jgi:hypothetical protein
MASISERRRGFGGVIVSRRRAQASSGRPWQRMWSVAGHQVQAMTCARASENVFVAAAAQVKKHKKRKSVTNTSPEPAISCRVGGEQRRQEDDTHHFMLPIGREVIVKGSFGDCEKT